MEDMGKEEGGGGQVGKCNSYHGFVPFLVTVQVRLTSIHLTEEGVMHGTILGEGGGYAWLHAAGRRRVGMG